MHARSPFGAFAPLTLLRAGPRPAGEDACLRDDAAEEQIHKLSLPAGFEFGEDLLGDFLEGFEDAHALEGDGFDDWLIFLA